MPTYYASVKTVYASGRIVHETFETLDQAHAHTMQIVGRRSYFAGKIDSITVYDRGEAQNVIGGKR